MSDKIFQWRSLEEKHGGPLAPSPEVPPDGEERAHEGSTRRGFLKVLGAAPVLASLAACGEPKGKALPFTRGPEGVTPGNALHYATAVATTGGLASALIATSYDGRPTKLEGNPDHPASLGATGLVEQALLLQLYDPNRARTLRRGGKPIARGAFWQSLHALADAHAADGGKRLRFLVEPEASPLARSLLARITQRFVNAKVVPFSSLPRDAIYEGARLAFGEPLETHVDLTTAQVIVALDDDFLGGFGPLSERPSLARQYGESREPPRVGGMSRLYAIECDLTPTGMAADHRLRMRASDIAGFAVALLAEIARTGDATAQAASARLAPTVSKICPSPSEKQKKWVAALAADLKRAGSKSVILVGQRQPAAVHATVHAIHALLASECVSQGPPLLDPMTGASGLKALVDEINAGAVDTLVITAWNPVYAAPADVDLGGALAKVRESIYLSLHDDETARRVTAMAPAAHPLESWGDALSADGTTALAQPLIHPLYGGMSALELYAAIAGERDAGSMALVHDAWRARSAEPDFERTWRKALQRGVLVGPAPRVHPAAKLEAIVNLLTELAAPAPGLEINFVADRRIGDGRHANNAWLQELPDPATKLTWDNAAIVSPSTAKRLGIATAQLVDLTLDGRTLRAPALILPGHADESVTIALGFGRDPDGAELNARGVGVRAAALRTVGAPWFRAGLSLTPSSEQATLAFTQEHWTMEERPLALELPIAAVFGRDNTLAIHQVSRQRGPQPSNYADHDYSKGHKWAMSIDLGRCSGCSACVVACQSENNIPAVGKAQITKSREMQWLRLDRYFTGEDEDDPRAINQPVMCQHCEDAPCEYVCPVNATVHSDEGLNEMVYNRCVGTRYCSNNCPYKVRRFNYLAYTSNKTPVEKLLMNPDVTVRTRGVMEKCTYCVQRIERKRIDARVEGRDIGVGEIVTACQQVCPTKAIVFGDLNRMEDPVFEKHADIRNYQLLFELGTRPRTVYLARARNANAELAEHG